MSTPLLFMSSRHPKDTDKPHFYLKKLKTVLSTTKNSKEIYEVQYQSNIS